MTNQSNQNEIENLEKIGTAEDLAISSESKESYKESIDDSEMTSAETCRAGLDE